MTQRILFGLFVLLCGSPLMDMNAQDPSIRISSSELTIIGDRLIVSMDVEVNRTLKSNETIQLTPSLRDSLDHFTNLPSIYIHGRKQHYVFLREQAKMEKGYVELLRKNKQKQTIRYLRAVHLNEWMKSAHLEINEEQCQCGIPIENHAFTEQRIVEQSNSQDSPYEQFLLSRKPTQAPKSQGIVDVYGIAFLDFPLNDTTIYSSYRQNQNELNKMYKCIDEVLNQSNLQLDEIELHGYASPEGAYLNNERLSKGRTEALKRHIIAKYNLSEELISTKHTAEDWTGLKQLLQLSEIENKPELLKIIDAPIAPDKKEQRIRQRFPESFKMILKQLMPALRRTDYVIKYRVTLETNR